MRPAGFSSIEGHWNIDESDLNEGVALLELAKTPNDYLPSRVPQEKAPTARFSTVERHGTACHLPPVF